MTLLNDGGILEAEHDHQHIFDQEYTKLDLAHKYQRHILGMEAWSEKGARDQHGHDSSAKITEECWETFRGLIKKELKVPNDTQLRSAESPPRIPDRETTVAVDGISYGNEPSTTMDDPSGREKIRRNNLPALEPGSASPSPETPIEYDDGKEMTGRQPRKRKKSEALESPIRFERGLGLQGTGARPLNIYLDNEAVMDEEDLSLIHISEPTRPY